VFGVLTETVRPTDTSGDLLGRLRTAGAGLLVATLDAIEAARCRPCRSPPTGVSLAPKLTAADARVDWSAPALRVDRLVRACTPAPGRVDDLPRQAGQARAGRRSPTSPARAGELAGDLVGTATTAVRLGGCARGQGRDAAPTGCAACAPSPGERLA
jgi:methionyl-tRNA formyltransferase